MVDYAELVPLRQPWPFDMRTAPWGRGRWKQFRAWCLARASGGLPLVVWGAGGIPTMLPACPFCGVAADLRHVLRECRGTVALRSALPGCAAHDAAAWAMRRVGVQAGLEVRVQYFGRCMARLIAAMRRPCEEVEVRTASAAPGPHERAGTAAAAPKLSYRVGTAMAAPRPSV